MTDTPNTEGKMRDLSAEILRRKRIIAGELVERTLWLVKLRWWVPPSITAGVAVAWRIGVKFAAIPLLVVACFILAYNVIFFFWSRRIYERPQEEVKYIERFTYWQVGLDYGAMFLLIHYTGGAASPFIFFFIFHIIFASILLPSRSAYGFSALVAAGMLLIAAAEYLHLMPHYALYFRERAIDLAEQPFHMMAEMAFFTASVFITAFSTTSIMRQLRRRIVRLADLSDAVTLLNNKFQTLYAMIQAIGSAQRIDLVLKIVTQELARVTNVKAISVKLLSNDGKYLYYASAYGLPNEFLRGKVIEVDKSPINRVIIEGQPYVTGRVTQREMFQFGEDLAQVSVQSVLFVPLVFEERVTGILGAYCERPDRFDNEEVDFFRLAAGLVAIALENARAYEAVENLISERSKFMMRVAHNMRAPLAAMLSVIEVLRDGYKGDLNDKQREYLRRVERRARTMLSLISELMTISRNRSEVLWAQYAAPIRIPIDLNAISGRIQRTFQEEAAEKKLAFQVTAPDGLPKIIGDPDLIEQMLENIISNAIKYTRSGGRVGVAFSAPPSGGDSDVRIEVSDNGIGIPKADRGKLFCEFFRADNARAVEEIGTGLGLAIVKDIVDRHGGRIFVESEEGLGTIFVVHLPVTRNEVLQ